MLTVRQAAARACVCEGTVRGWLAARQLPHLRVGAVGRRGKILIAEEDLDALLATFRVGAAPTTAPAPPRRPPPATGFRHLRV